MVGASIALAGRLLGVAFASGFNLYATVATLGLAARLGWIDPLPVPLRGLESPMLIAGAAALVAVEYAVARLRHADSIWDAIHTFIRPMGAALLALGLLAGESMPVVVGGATVAGAAALAGHGTRAGLRLRLETAGNTRGAAIGGAAHDAMAVAFTIAAFRYPDIALIAAALAAVAIVLFARPLLRAFALGLRAFNARIRSLLRQPRWLDIDALPRSLRAQFAPPTIGDRPYRVARVAFLDLADAGEYRNGWLVVTHHEPVFAYRSRFRARRAAVPRARSTRVRRGLWTDRIDIEAEDGSHSVLFLLKDGPPAAHAAAELEPVGP